MSEQDRQDEADVMEILGFGNGNATWVACRLTWPKHGSDRRLDRCFQRLRRRGLIRFDREGRVWGRVCK